MTYVPMDRYTHLTTSTPPAWKWLSECEVPIQVYQHMTSETPSEAELSTDPGYYDVCGFCHEPCRNHTEEVLSIHSQKLPESDAFREQNDSDQCANGEQCPPSAPIPSDQCDECRCAPSAAHNAECVCDVSCGPVISCDRKHDNRHDGEPLATVESCPECGTVTDIEYPAKTADRMSGTFDVPFQVQSWTFEALIELEVDRLHEIIDDYHDEIVEMARKRHREGFVAHGSKGYQWDAKTRLRNVLEELSDAPTYLTMGPIE